jgi:hypothetical protein
LLANTRIDDSAIFRNMASPNSRVASDEEDEAKLVEKGVASDEEDEAKLTADGRVAVDVANVVDPGVNVA